MKKGNPEEGRKPGPNVLNTVVNVAVLLFLGYALLGPGGPLRMKMREHASLREARMGVDSIFDWLASKDRVDKERPTIIEFTDFQCPYCRDMHDVLRLAVAEDRFDVVVMHFPLEQIHPLAIPAAKGSLCAEMQGSEDQMNHLLMSTRDWMDDSDWLRLARNAGIPDLEQFEECLISSSTEQELAQHISLARDIGISGTPAFVSSSGGVHRGTATLDELVQLAKNR